MLEKIKSKLKSDFMKVYFFDMVAKVFTLAISIIIIRCLSQADYAQYTLFTSIGSFISGVLGSGMGLAYTRYAVMLHEKKDHADGLLYKNLRGKLLILSGCVLAISIIAYVLLKDLSYVYVFGIAYGLTLALYQLNVVFYQARERFSMGGIVSNVKNILVAVVLFVIFISPIDTQLLPTLLIYLIAIISSWLVTTFLINKTLKIENLAYDNATASLYFKDMVKDSIWIILYMFMLSAFNQLDVMLLNQMRTAEDVANYGVAYKYYANVLSLLPALQVVLRVRNSKKEVVENSGLQRQSVVQWLRKSSPLAGALFVLGVIAAYIALPILNGVEYNAAIITFDILLVGACLSYMTAPNVSIMISAGKQKTLFFLSIGSFLINLVGNLIFIPVYGANAAACTTILAHFFLNGGSTMILLLTKEENN